MMNYSGSPPSDSLLTSYLRYSAMVRRLRQAGRDDLAQRMIAGGFPPDPNLEAEVSQILTPQPAAPIIHNEPGGFTGTGGYRPLGIGSAGQAPRPAYTDPYAGLKRPIYQQASQPRPDLGQPPVERSLYGQQPRPFLRQPSAGPRKPNPLTDNARY